MSFAQPIYLWTLLGLLVPIAIHLWSKKEAKTIKIGSVQLLSESTSKQSSSIQLNEWWLLVLRMFIIGLITLVLAKPQWYASITNSSLTYIVEPELLKNDDFMSRFADIDTNQEIRILCSNLPLAILDEEFTRDEEFMDYWALAAETNALKTDSIVVFTNGYSKGLKGARPETNHNIKWIILETSEVVIKPLIVYKNENDFQLFSGKSSSLRSEISNKQVVLGEDYALTTNSDSLLISNSKSEQKVPVVVQKPLEIALYYTDSLSTDKTYIEAALKALSKYLNRDIRVESMLDTEAIKNKNADLIIWLSTKPAPVYNQKILLLKKSVSNALIDKGEDDTIFYLTKRITPENAISERLTENLLHILDVNKEVEKLLGQIDKRLVTEEDLQTNYIEDSEKQTQLASFDINPYLWGVLFILLILERFIAYKRKQ